MKIRAIINQALEEIIIDQRYSNLVINNYLKTHEFSDPDRKLFSKVILGVLKNYALINYFIEEASLQKSPKPKTRIILAAALYQIWYLDRVPEYAVINDSVELAKELDGPKGGGYVNAVLHSLFKRTNVLDESKFDDPKELYCLKNSFPLFIMKMCLKHISIDCMRKIIQHNGEQPPLYLRVNELVTTKEELLKNPDFIDTISPFGLEYIGKAPLVTTPEFIRGDISVQDISGQFIAPLLEASENDLILDMCAAPGSKSIHLGQILNNKGKIVSCDLHKQRMDLLLKGAKRMGITNISALIGDANRLDKKFGNEYFDKILLDAPCSGLGTTWRKPDILITITPERIDSVLAEQYSLLESAYKLLKVNGILVYSTCTYLDKENSIQVAEFLKRHTDMELVNSQQIYGFENNTDGFYFAKMKKNG
jgi:16S rRNA (cytosine967-C5)-methyltransferase